MNRNLLCAVAFAGSLLSEAHAAEGRFADVVLQNGEIYTAVDSSPWVQGIAFRDGRVSAIGSDADMRLLIGPKTQVIDLLKRMAMPGLNDVHVHVLWAVRDLARYTCKLPAYASLEELLATVRNCSKGKGSDDWIVGQHFGSDLFPRIEKSEAIKLLDEASGGRPVLLRSDTIHDRWVNSRALQLAGFTKETSNPPRTFIGRDSRNGELNGLLFESAGTQVDSLIPQSQSSSPQQTVADLRSGIRMLNSFGVTMFQDAFVTPPVAEAYHELDQRAELTARVNLSLLIDPKHSETQDLETLYSKREVFRSDLVSLDFAKIFLDGVMPAQTALFLDPYLPSKEHGSSYRGVPYVPAPELNRIVTELDKRGIAVKMHTSGDGAIREGIDAVEAARRTNGPNGPIHQLAHAGYMAPSDMPRLKPLNIVVDASPTVWYPGPIQGGSAAVMGKERADRLFPMKTFLANGILIAGGTDWKTLPGEFSDIWSGIEGLVTRQNPTGKFPGALLPQEAIDLSVALKMYTINSALAMRKAATTGSLEVGKSADLIVLNQNVFKIKPEAISETKVLATYLEGKRVFAAEGMK